MSDRDHLTRFLETALPLDGNRSRRIQSYYIPLALRTLEHARSRTTARPLFVGIHGAQGCGKSTLTHHLVGMLGELGVKALSLSIDDFYLTRAEQVALAARHADNPYLQQRGYPGTHDLALGRKTLEALSKAGEEGTAVTCPVYDKSAHSGQGDRLPAKEWKTASGPIDVVFLEGWMLAFSPVTPQKLPNPHFEPINRSLGAYDTWREYLDTLIHLCPKEIAYVVDWRIEAEERMKAQGKPGMTREEIRSYVEKFLPAYETYLPGLKANPPLTRTPPLTLTLGQDRLPL